MVATRVRNHGEKIRDEGFRLLPLRLRRRGRAPWTELPAIFELIKILLRERPDILHQVGLKPVIYGSIAAILARPKVVINGLAARALKFRDVPVHIKLVGAPDPDNPSNIPERTLRQWDREGCIEWVKK